MNYNRLIKTLIKHEGLKTKIYLDTVGKWTIGAGRNLTDVGISEAEAIILLKNDIEIAQKEIIKYVPEFRSIDSIRQEVLINMMYNMGSRVFSRFKLFIAAVVNKEWEIASAEMLNSRWANQVGDRAIELSKMMRSGKK